MQERRKQPRKDLMSYSQVFELYHGKLIGYLGDITFLGAMVIGEDPYEVGAELNISIQLPEQCKGRFLSRQESGEFCGGRPASILELIFA